MKNLNIGVIGLGAIGLKHCSALVMIERATIAAVADVDEKALEATAKQYNATPYNDFKKMLTHPGLDAVLIATPDQLHRDACVLAAEAGKHVLVEKPIATTISDAEDIIRATDKAGVKLVVGFSLRFSPHYLHAKKVAADGTLGDLVSIFARRLNVITQPDRLKGRCGVVMFLGTHDFDAMRWIVGSEPISIYCESSTSVPSAYPIDNETFSIIRFKNGVIGCAHIGWYLQTQHPAGRDFKLDLIGNKGSLNLDQMRQGVEVYTASGAKFPSIGSGLYDEDRAFVDCVLDNKPSPATGQDGLASLRMVLGAMESMKTHQSVAL
jgi:UDP-N-acetylglucosamine 3-dehydrogenase